MENKEQQVPVGIGMAVMTGRVELLKVAMRALRANAEAGELVGERLDHVLNALEAACAVLITERHPPRRDMDDDDEDDLDYAGL